MKEKLMLMGNEKEKSPSKKLKERIRACVSSFRKLGTAVKEALEQGREEGFTDKEVGKMIRDELVQAGFDRSTVASYLPSSAKQKPRGKPGLGNKISRKNLQTEAVEYPMLEQELIQESDVLARDDFKDQKKQIDEEKNGSVPEARVVDAQRVTSSGGDIELQSAYIELDPTEGEYDIENLEKYSRRTLERIIKWQHKHLQECHNEATSSLTAYKKDTGKDRVD